MCLIVFAWKQHPLYRLVLVANRDEFYARNTLHAHFWEQSPDVFGGLDLEAGGSWMGVTRQGRIAALTNYRDMNLHHENMRSRGMLVKQVLTQKKPIEKQLADISDSRHDFNPFNLLLGDEEKIYCLSSQKPEQNPLEPGIYGLCNHLLDTPWPKLVKAKSELDKCLHENHLSPKYLIRIMQDSSVFDDRDLPDTGIDPELERGLSPLFIKLPAYGTRATTVILSRYDNKTEFWELSYDKNGQPENLVCQMIE